MCERGVSAYVEHEESTSARLCVFCQAHRLGVSDSSAEGPRAGGGGGGGAGGAGGGGGGARGPHRSGPSGDNMQLAINLHELGLINLPGAKKKKDDKLADIHPLDVDTSVDWDAVGGLDGHVRALKEMVMLPLMYPEVFTKLGVAPPKGVLFFGPPGTGKTLVARALANSCAAQGQKVTFFMRKGADCLSKWVGEAERQLKLLFDQAKAHAPAIIFFDEVRMI